jgi:hypothetical protein
MPKCARIASMVAAPRAALIEQERVEATRIEQPPVQMLRAAARSAVQEYRRNAVGAADLLDVQPMSVAHAQHARIEWA